MVGAGMVMTLLAALGLFLLVKQQLLNRRWLLWIFVGAIALPYIGNTTGWIFTEMGRQPWLVFGVLKTADGISPNVTPIMVLTSLIIFIVLYGILAVVDVFLLSKFARKGVEETEHSQNQEEEQYIVSY
jgi:cytochrome d ubiquinol oxidase subunit I